MKPTIFIVEDNLMMREFLRNFFAEDYQVKVFEQASQALFEITTQKKPDLLLLDYEMEGLNGFELLRKIKQSGLHQNIPVMFLSGKQKSDIRIQCLEEGADDFLAKPFNPAELNLRVKNIINRNQSVSIS
jgi:DNA-binding response OmpR family regulator